MNNKERGQRIRQQILRDVQHHPSDIAKHIAQIFSISPQAVHNHIKRLEEEQRLSSSGKGKGKRYFLGEIRGYNGIFPLTKDFAEDPVWRNFFSFVFEGLPDNVFDICHYGFTEMVNNAIDHSSGDHVFISSKRSLNNLEIIIIDNGEGIFRRIMRLCNLADERQALLELSKGKLTTDPDNHTGEGIFFTSRAFDKFEIDSKGLRFSHEDCESFDYFLESSISKEEAGTLVYMAISRSSERTIESVYDAFTAGPEEFQFNKTVIPVRLAQYKNEKLVSRSQAKRILARIEKFEHVIFDFDAVESIGQAFADEIFRVYAIRHPHIQLVPVNMTVSVNRFVNKAVIEAKNQQGNEVQVQ